VPPRDRFEGKGLSVSRVRQTHQLLGAVIRFAVRAKHLAANPADGVELPRLPQIEQRYPTRAAASRGDRVGPAADSCAGARVLRPPVRRGRGAAGRQLLYQGTPDPGASLSHVCAQDRIGGRPDEEPHQPDGAGARVLGEAARDRDCHQGWRGAGVPVSAR
jgi:hypothetical protein